MMRQIDAVLRHQTPRQTVRRMKPHHVMEVQAALAFGGVRVIQAGKAAQ